MVKCRFCKKDNPRTLYCNIKCRNDYYKETRDIVKINARIADYKTELKLLKRKEEKIKKQILSLENLKTYILLDKGEDDGESK